MAVAYLQVHRGVQFDLGAAASLCQMTAPGALDAVATIWQKAVYWRPEPG